MNKKGIHDLKNTVIYRNPTAISSDLDGEAVILDMESGKYHSLDTTGTRVWELLEDKISFNDIVLKLMSEYSVEGQQCTTDVKEFINQLIDLGLVETENS
jgi:ubiquitin C-terminal hydrolase|tara:strand:- start:1979 stop:2278 length:300 start_codon:yes stop_codon:yes gene_type:complete